MSLGNLTTRFEQVGGKKLIHKIQVDDVMLHAEVRTMPSRQRDLPVVVLGTVFKTDRAHDLMLPQCPVQRGHRIHPAGE